MFQIGIVCRSEKKNMIFWNILHIGNVQALSYGSCMLRVIACNSGTQMRVRDSSATRIFF